MVCVGGFSVAQPRTKLGGIARNRGGIFLCSKGPSRDWTSLALSQILDFNFDTDLLDGVSAMGKFMRLCVTDPLISKVPFMIDSSPGREGSPGNRSYS